MQYCDDVWLMFNNAWLYNRKTSRVYKYCTKVRGSCGFFIEATDFFCHLYHTVAIRRSTVSFYITSSGFISMQNYWKTSLACFCRCIAVHLSSIVLNLTVVWGFWTRNWSCNEKVRILLWKKGKDVLHYK